MLVVNIKGSDELRTYVLDAAGRFTGPRRSTRSHGSTPFGFTFDPRGRLLARHGGLQPIGGVGGLPVDAGAVGIAVR